MDAKLAACKTLANGKREQATKKEDKMEGTPSYKDASITDGWALEGRRGRGREGRGEASTVMVETHAWIVARSASGTSERAVGASCRLWERRWERATRCMY